MLELSFVTVKIQKSSYRVTQKKRAPILIILNTRGPFFWVTSVHETHTDKGLNFFTQRTWTQTRKFFMPWIWTRHFWTRTWTRIKNTITQLCVWGARAERY